MNAPKEQLPSKADLLSQDLVITDNHHKRISTNSMLLADKLDKRHYDITRKVDSLLKKGLIGKRELSLTYYLDQWNRKKKYYILEEEAALQVVMGLSGHKAELLHKEIARLFVSMKDELIEWRATREDIKPPTLEVNEAIHWLQAELKKEIPKSSKSTRIFIHIHKRIIKMATGNANTLRDDMNREQLNVVDLLDKHVRTQIVRMSDMDVPATLIRNWIMGSIFAEPNPPRDRPLTLADTYAITRGLPAI